MNIVSIYRKLWKNRPTSCSELEIMQLIQSELLDELTHPRLRKTKEEKFYIATKRIVQSSLTNDERTELLTAYISVFEKLK